MQTKNSPSVHWLLSAVLLSLSLTAWAQIKSSTITGTVNDSSGAVIPGASVSVISQETNVTLTTITDESGSFTVPYLAPGIYTVNVEKTGSGFSKASRTNLTLSTAQTIKIELTLQAGGAADTVTITADAAALQVTNATVGGQVNERTIQTLPNITHNPFNYVVLQAEYTRANINASGTTNGLPATPDASITANPTQNLKIGQLQNSGTFGTFGQAMQNPHQIEIVMKFRF